MPIAHFSSSWEAPPTVLVAAAVAALLFAQAFVRLRRRRAEHAPWTRPVLFSAGLALLVLPLVSPLDEWGDDHLLSAHMLQHVLIGDAAAALLVVAVRGPLVFFLLPPSVLRPLAAFRPLRALLSVLLLPLVSLGLWTTAILAWHVPRLYDYAAAHPAVHDLEHLSFVVTGVLAWMQLVDPARHGRLRRPQRILFALAMLAITQPLVDVLLFSSAPRYDRYANPADRLFGLSPLTDQRLAGAVMMVEQLLTLGICVALLLRPYLVERRGRGRPPRRPRAFLPGPPTAGTFADSIRFHTARARGRLPLRTDADELSAFTLTRLASPLPPFVPSVNQIGFDSYEWIVGCLDVSPPGAREGSLLLWVIGARRGEHGVPVADPTSAFAFPLAGRYRDDAVILSDRGLTLTFSFGEVPFDRIDFRGQLSQRLRMRPGANLYAEVVCADVPFYGPFLAPLTRLCNADGKLIASGTFITRAYPRRGRANRRPEGLRVTGVEFQRPGVTDGSVVARLARSGGVPYRASEHVTSILLVDGATGAPVVLDYKAETTVTSDATGDVSDVVLRIPAGTAVPESVTAYVIADVFPLHRQPLP